MTAPEIPPTEKLTKDIALRALIFGLVFYLINDNVTEHLLRQYIPIPVGITQTLLFVSVYVGISCAL
jgi:hypothetical protein